jgi:ArsR family transcriptional regulator, arsenate/arsenite/antimonite-responsive transcriptional repressor
MKLANHSPQWMPLTTLLSIGYIPIREYNKEILMRDFIRVMKALSDPNRVKMLKMLQLKSLCVCELQAALQLAQPTASKHLKILEEAGLVNARKSGLWVNYHLTDGSASPYAATLLGNLKHWLQHDPEVVHLVERLPAVRREDICKKEPLPFIRVKRGQA